MNSAVPVTLYEQVQTRLLHEIQSGEYAGFDRLPPEPELCARFGVSRITLRRAVAGLEEAGIVRRQQGRGTFVTRRRDKLGTLSLDGFSDLVSGPGARSRKIISAEVEAADEEHANELEIAVGDPIFHLRRVLALDGVPLVLDSSRYPLSRYPGFDELIAENVSTYQVLREEYGVVFTEMHRDIGLEFPSSEAAAQLELSEPEPVLTVRKRALGEKAEVVHTTRGKLVASRLTLHVVSRERG